MQKSLTSDKVTKITLALLATVIFFILSFSLVSAQESTGSTPPPPPPRPPKAIIKEDIKDARGKIINERADMRQDIGALRKDLKVNTSSTTSSEARGEMRNKMKEDIKDRREMASSTIKNVKEDRNQKIKESLALVRARLIAASDRLDKIVARVESRMKKLSEAGADTSKEKVLVDQAKGLIAEVRSSIANATTQSDLVTTSTNPKEQFGKVKTQYNSIQENLKKAQKILSEAVSMLAKERRVTKETSATSSNNEVE